MGCGGSKTEAKDPQSQTPAPQAPSSAAQAENVTPSSNQQPPAVQKPPQPLPPQQNPIEIKRDQSKPAPVQEKKEEVKPEPTSEQVKEEPPAEPQKPIQPQQLPDYNQDQKVEFDEDIHLQITGKRVDKAGNQREVYGRGENRPEDDQKMIGFFEMEETGEGDQHLAIKPWIGAIKEPTETPQIKSGKPDISLELQYVFGYRCFDTRQNIFYTSTPGVIVYMTAALAVVLDTNNNTQRFFGAGESDKAKGHNDDITALAIHSDRDLVATGQVGANPKVCVWKASDPESGPVSQFFIGRGRRAVTALAISSCGKKVAVADLEDDHYVSVWCIQSSNKLFQEKGGKDKILDISWCPGKDRFCTVGIKHIKFWDLEQGNMEEERGIYCGKGPMCNMTSVGWLSDGTCLTGGTNGRVYHWAGRQLQRTVQVIGDGKSIHTLNVVDDIVIVGGKDNKVHRLNKDLEQEASLPVDSCPRAVDRQNASLIVGQRNGSIVQFTGGQPTVVMESHSDGEVWGLVQKEDLIVSSGDDNKIKVWSVTEKKCIRTGIIDAKRGQERKSGYGASTMASTTPNQQSRSLALNHSNGHLAVAHNTGMVTIRASVQDLDSVAFTLEDPKEWIEAMSYSPDGSKLAVGSHDNAVYVYDVANGYTLLQKMHKHSSFITALDWSENGAALHSTCGAYELLFWDVESGQQVTFGASQFCDEKWHTWTTPLGWPVQGVFGNQVDMTYVNRVERSPCGNYVVIGNDWGYVEIYWYPNAKGSRSRTFRGHSEHVTNVKNSGSYVYSAGGYDNTIMCWKISQ